MPNVTKETHLLRILALPLPLVECAGVLDNMIRSKD